MVPHNKSATVNVKLVNEDCNQKEAEKQFEWKVCEQEMSIPGLQIGDADKAEIINQILDELFKFESGFMSDNYQEIIFTTANIDPAWLKSFPGINFSFLTPQKIQVKANSSKEGRVDYYAFNWQPGNTCAFVGISAVTAVSINKPERKDPNVFYCPVGTSKGYLFRKEAGIWKMKQSRG